MHVCIVLPMCKSWITNQPIKSINMVHFITVLPESLDRIFSTSQKELSNKKSNQSEIHSVNI